jgi:hypothetical protein
VERLFGFGSKLKLLFKLLLNRVSAVALVDPMSDQNDEPAIPVEGIRHASGITRSTSEFRNEDSGKPHTHKRWYTDSPVGEIEVTVTVKVLQFHLVEDGADPFLEMELRVQAGDTCEQPDRWSVTYFHYADVIMRGIEAYLKRYCPAPDEVLDVLRLRQIEIYVWKGWAHYGAATVVLLPDFRFSGQKFSGPVYRTLPWFRMRAGL